MGPGWGREQRIDPVEGPTPSINVQLIHVGKKLQIGKRSLRSEVLPLLSCRGVVSDSECSVKNKMVQFFAAASDVVHQAAIRASCSSQVDTEFVSN